jgi:Flp pilus assembly protein TadD/TolB-like protein
MGIALLCVAFLMPGSMRSSRLSQSTSGTHPSTDSSRAGTLLVFPFENGSRIASVDWLGEGLSELTVERLEDRGLNVLSRQDRLATLEKIGLPDSARFSHATMVKIATEADADEVVLGRFVSDGKTVTLEARVLRINPPWLSKMYTQSGSLDSLLRIHARLTWEILCALEQRDCAEQAANVNESSFSDPPASLRQEALENFIHGITASDDESRMKSLREAARLEPAWDRPAFELGQLYFARHNCESALPWFSRVPPNRADGPEASFNTGVCHLQRGDAARAEASFSGLIERTRSVDPKDRLPEMSEIHNNLGVARLRLGKFGDAAAEFERAAALDAEEPLYWENLGIVKLAAKQPDAAITPLERARKLDPDDKLARPLLISAFESLGRASDAAALRAEISGGAGAAAPVQDPVALARQARVSMKFDRSLLHLEGESAAAKPARKEDSRKKDDNGVQR